MGRRRHRGPAALTAIAPLLLLRSATLCIGMCLALDAGEPEMVQMVQALVRPAVFLPPAVRRYRALGR